MSKPRNFLIVVISFFLVLLLVFVILLMIHVKKTDSVVLIDDLTCGYGEKIHVSKFIKDIDGELLDDYLVDTSSIGEKRIDIQYKNQYGFVERKRFSVRIKDIVAPIIKVDTPYIVTKGEVSDLSDIIFCADDYDDKVLCEISGEYNLDQVGSYQVNVVAIDKSGNETKKDFVLNVVEENSDSKTIKFDNIYKKYKTDSNSIGISLSSSNNDIDLGKISSLGINFLMLGIGEQDKIGGEYSLNSKMLEYIEKASNYGLKTGLYVRSYAKNESEAKRQARILIKSINKYKITLPISFCWGAFNNVSNYGVSIRSLNKIAGSFLSEVKRNGYDGMICSNQFYFDNVWYKSNYKKFVYNSSDSYNDYMIRQVYYGNIDGIDGIAGILVMED